MAQRAKTKIVATLGPASGSYTIIRKMIMAGLDVARLNFSHGKHSEHLKKIETVRKINEKYKRRIKILQDLEGYRIRIGRFKDGKYKNLVKRSTVWLTKEEDNGDEKIIPFDYTADLKIVKTGQLIFIDDGNIIFKVKNTTKNTIKVEVIEGDLIKERKGINMPGVKIPFSGVTEKDIKDLHFGIKNKVDFVAQSFVRYAKDVEKIRSIVEGEKAKSLIVSKIESREAIKNIDKIIDVSDGIMVARGDMGVAVPIYEIPVLQKMIIRKCNKKKKFVITATEMMEHMTEHSRPTRAEVTDVANAIIDGTDYVMLSGETAAGKYPVQSVKMMDQVIKYTEGNKQVYKSGATLQVF